MEKCWSVSVSERPSIKEIQDEIRNILNDYNKKGMPQAEMEIMNQVHVYEKMMPNPGTTDQGKIVSPDRIRNEIPNGIGLASYALPKETREVAIKSLKIISEKQPKQGRFYVASL